jgi:excisionase family DNA binding protein
VHGHIRSLQNIIIMSTAHLEKLVYTLTEAARLLGYKHEKTVRRMNQDGQIEIVRLRSKWVVRREELARLINNLPPQGA